MDIRLGTQFLYLNNLDHPSSPDKDEVVPGPSVAQANSKKRVPDSDSAALSKEKKTKHDSIADLAKKHAGVVRDLKAQKPWQTIAKERGVRIATITALARSEGFPTTDSFYTPLSEQDVKKAMVFFHIQGQTVRQISDELGCAPELIEQELSSQRARKMRRNMSLSKKREQAREAVRATQRGYTSIADASPNEGDTARALIALQTPPDHLSAEPQHSSKVK